MPRGAQALFVSQARPSNTHRVEIAARAQRARLPAIFGFREFAIACGMMSYGPSLPAVYRRFATLVDKILKGETPANLPIEFPRGSSWSSISRPLTSNSATVSELKETRTIPIVLANMPDPVALGFAQNLARPAAMSPDSRVLRRHLPPNGLSC
jgi:ABC-type uncharacterized transport system substrate-binding protein